MTFVLGETTLSLPHCDLGVSAKAVTQNAYVKPHSCSADAREVTKAA